MIDIWVNRCALIAAYIVPLLINMRFCYDLVLVYFGPISERNSRGLRLVYDFITLGPLLVAFSIFIIIALLVSKRSTQGRLFQITCANLLLSVMLLGIFFISA